MLDKARWYNDAQCPVVLTIDDLTYGYMDPGYTGLGPDNDWGYGCLRPGSLCRYFEDHFLARHPEVRYTAFLPFGASAVGRVDTAYPKHIGDIFASPEFGELLQHIVRGGHEIAYHGHDHGRHQPTLEPRSWDDEDTEYTPEAYRALVATDLERARRELGLVVRGGRTPAYRNHPSLLHTVASGLFRWWSFDYTPGACAYAYRGGVFAFPTNISGGVLRRSPGRALGLWRVFRYERALARLLAERAILCVTEHYTGSRPDARRQTPNIFDDLDSLHRIFGFFKGVDVWHATCTEIARYQEAYDHTRLTLRGDGTCEVLYTGSWEDPYVSLGADAERLLNVATGATLRAGHKCGRWVFPRVPPGVYREV